MGKEVDQTRTRCIGTKLQMSLLEKLDLFNKTPQKLQERSSVSGIASLLIFAFCAFLVFSEVQEFLTTKSDTEFYVDVEREEMIKVFFDFSFPHLQCKAVTLDVVDETGGHSVADEHSIIKIKLDENMSPLAYAKQKDLAYPDMDTYVLPLKCGSCYSAQEEGMCCNTCADVIDAYRKAGLDTKIAQSSEQCLADKDPHLPVKGEMGCRVQGYVTVRKAQGNIHLAAGVGEEQNHGGEHTHHVHRIDFSTLSNFNISHIIHNLQFGEKPVPYKLFGKAFNLNFLNRDIKIEQGLAQYTYILSVVPIAYTSKQNKVEMAYDYSMSEHRKEIDLKSRQFPLPGVYFKYNFDAIAIRYREK